MHGFCHVDGFYFHKKQLQWVEAVTPFIIYYLYSFNDNASLHAESTSLLDKALQGMESNFMLPEEFKYMKIPDINIHQGVRKLSG
jgi:hypothetical protein